MRVVVSGYYGFGNLGDEALLGGLADGLRRRGHQVVVLSGDPAATRAAHGVAATHRLYGAPFAIARADAVVSGGGGLLQDATSTRSLRYYLAVMRLARLLGKRVVVYAQSLGPLSPSGRASVARAMAGASVAVRDEASLSLARALGANPVLVADPALLVPAPVAAEAEERPVILVPRGGQDELNRALTTLARALVAANVPVAALALHAAHDEAAVARLASEVPEVEVRRARDVPEALHVLSHARYVVSVRLHGCILAARLGIGFAGLSYDLKVRGFLEQARAPAFEAPVDVRSLRELAMLAPPPEEHAVHHLLALAEEGIAWLDDTLRGGQRDGQGRRRSSHGPEVR
ncbi:MAG: polysaccharide pyruvyl transferase CsaB [Trueperaceae bacterium]